MGSNEIDSSPRLRLQRIDSSRLSTDPLLKNVNIYASGPPTLAKETRYLVVYPDGYGKSRPTWARTPDRQPVTSRSISNVILDSVL